MDRRRNPSARVRILIADVRPIVLHGLLRALESRPELYPVGTASDTRGALRLAGLKRPHVAVVGHRLPPEGGVAAIVQLARKSPETRTILLLSIENSEDLYRAIRAGTRGCLLSTATLPECADTIRSVHEGQFIVPRILSSGLARRLGEKDLTDRESKVLRLLVAGRSNKEIGAELGIVEGTVKIHVKRILRKLDVRSRLEAATVAVRRGMVTAP